jgi:ABC-type dipeptide/oligopeptide/nickel transport system permease subunit
MGIGFLTLLALLAVLGDRLWFVRSFDERVRVGGDIANQYGLGPGRAAWFGTDALGSDIFAKCLYGARTTLVVGVVATLVGLGLGCLLGIVAGYRRGTTDRIAGVVTDALLSTPAIVLAIVIIVKLDTIKETQTWLGWFDRRWQLTVTLAIVTIAPISRIVRARTLALREADYVLASRSLGATTSRILTREVLPNLVPTMLTVAVTSLSLLVAAEAALAFLGLSVDAPTPTWGRLIDDNRNAMSRAWWATFFPCLMLFLTVLSFNLVGDWLARRFDIRRAAI